MMETPSLVSSSSTFTRGNGDGDVGEGNIERGSTNNEGDSELASISTKYPYCSVKNDSSLGFDVGANIVERGEVDEATTGVWFSATPFFVPYSLHLIIEDFVARCEGGFSAKDSKVGAYLDP